MRFAGLVAVVVFSLTISCTTKEQKEEILAKQYCGTCHSYPEPSLLSKEAWRTVMPQMAVRMGIDISVLLRLSEADYPYVIQTLPKNPMMSENEFEAIMNYYEREAPDSLELPPLYETKELDQFEVQQLKLLNRRPTFCMVRADTINKRLWFANRDRALYEYDYNFKRIDSIKTPTAASSILFQSNNEHLVTLMGYMDPNDQPLGVIARLKGDTIQTLIDSLKRPVHLEQADLNNDKQQDFVVCNFGNYSGRLSVYENNNGQYREHAISELPGARRVIVKDFTGDGMLDILVMFSQGDENVSLYTNAGSFRFRVTTLLKFPPSYGSDYFDIGDFNNDGHWDIITVNGDNADYSKIFKPYHGVRVFVNDGENHFREWWFGQLYGASMALARDFDKDGDMDVAAVSFFPDFKKTPERGFVYFENNNGDMIPHTTPLAASGRWLLMETVDLDADGYLDILLSALDFDDQVTPAIDKQWNENPVDIMVLKNLSRSNRDRGKK